MGGIAKLFDFVFRFFAGLLLRPPCRSEPIFRPASTPVPFRQTPASHPGNGETPVGTAQYRSCRSKTEARPRRPAQSSYCKVFLVPLSFCPLSAWQASYPGKSRTAHGARSPARRHRFRRPLPEHGPFLPELCATRHSPDMLGSKNSFCCFQNRLPAA